MILSMAGILRNRALLSSLVLAFLFTTPTLKGQAWEVFDMANAGFPSNTVRAIAHGMDGTTWVGTDWGLCKYDGSTWEVLQVANSDIPENDIRALAVDDQNRLWVGFLSSGLSVLDGADWLHFTIDNSPLPTQTVRNIIFDGQGFAWLATTNGVVRTDLSDWRIYDNSETSYNNLMLPGTNISDIAVRSDGLVCIATLNAGFVYLTDTSVHVYSTTTTNLPDNTALGVALDSNGERWAACPSGGLLHNFGDFAGGFWSQYTTSNSGLPSNGLNDVVVDAMDRKIIATQQSGVAIYSSDDTWQIYNSTNSGLPDNEVNRLSMAPNGQLWVATANGGAARWDYTTSISAVEMPQVEVHLYPVPTKDALYFSIEGNTELFEWQLLNADGRVLKTGKHLGGTLGSIAVSDFASGGYLLRLKSARSTTISRFTVL